MAYIFCASTGNCGTEVLTRVFETFTDYPSFHEPGPCCAEQVMREVNNKCGINKTTREILNQKMDQILNDSHDGNYFESNSIFIKSYVERVIYKEKFRPLYMIYIERNPVDVLLSYVRKYPYFDLNQTIAPHWGNNQIQLHKGLSAPEQILHNWFEIRQRYYLYKQKADKSFEIDFNKIGDPKEIKKMFDYFGIEHKKLPEETLMDYHLSQEKAASLYFLLTNWKHKGTRKSVSASEGFFRRIEERGGTAS